MKSSSIAKLLVFHIHLVVLVISKAQHTDEYGNSTKQYEQDMKGKENPLDPLP
jgi:ABC-type cobalt transport system substrate-binding protein